MHLKLAIVTDDVEVSVTQKVQKPCWTWIEAKRDKWLGKEIQEAEQSTNKELGVV